LTVLGSNRNILPKSLSTSDGRRFLIALVGSGLIVLSFPAIASAHYERPTNPPDGTGDVPSYRAGGPHLIVCKGDQTDFEKRIAGFTQELQDYNRSLYAACVQSGYRDLQAAVDHVMSAGTTILVLPGLYLEEPSLLPEPDVCSHLPAKLVPAGYRILSYEQQKTCPHQQNLVGIFGIDDLQIEGTGATPADVVFDAQFQKLNVIRGDRTNGLYLLNFTAQRSTFNSVYVIETDGFVINHVVGRWNAEYGFLSFASDHGLMTNCEAYGNGDSGIYPGGTSDINRSRGFDVPRYAIEVTGCHSHDNLLGYSGTGGDSVWVHDNEFDHNTTGASMDSLFPNHPGLPQNHALFEHNLIHSNNTNYYPYVRDGTCRRPYLQRGMEKGVVCPVPGVPVGAGLIIVGGDYDLIRENWIYDNWKVGVVQTWVPGAVRNDFRWAAQEETSSFNRYLDNHMGTDAAGRSAPNGLDFYWDGQGMGNCWQADRPSGSDPLAAPGCPGGGSMRLLGDPNKLVLFGTCSAYNMATRTLPAGCDWFDTPPRPGSSGASLNVESIGPSVQLVVLLLLVGWLIRGGARLTWFGVGVGTTALVGALLLTGASVQNFYVLDAPGIALLGIAWIGAARLVPSRRLAALSIALGIVALAEAADNAVLMLPVPVGPVWIRLLLELTWMVWIGVVMLGSARRSRGPLAPTTPGREEREPLTREAEPTAV
jgi:hypothetical protein